MKSILFAVLAVGLLFHQVLANADLVTKANSFSNRLYHKASRKSGNALVCPISVYIALGLVLQGAGSNTSSQLASVLGFSADNAANIKESYKALLEGDNSFLKIATKLYPAKEYELNSSYVSVAQEYFLSGVESVDYTKPEEAANKINKYVEEHTNNQIHDLISPDSISNLTKLIIINAIHFQATWKKTFTTSYDEHFIMGPGRKMLTKMMSMTDFFLYKKDLSLDAKILKMDYMYGGYSMLFVLPNTKYGLRELEIKLQNTNLSNLLKDLNETKVEVAIPKFKLEMTSSLKDFLISMGITDMFSSQADLKGIANGNELYVSDVIQKTFINVHENGTEAAATTALHIEDKVIITPANRFRAKHPFVFYLIGNGVVLFNGRFRQPTPINRLQAHTT